MSRGRVDQFLAGYVDGDAISREARVIRGLLRSEGYESDIFVPRGRAGVSVKEDCFPLEEYRGGAEDSVLHHYAILSEATDLFLRVRGRRIIRYHNITPAEFFRGFDDATARSLDAARERLPEVVSAAAVNWADSEFNAKDLRAAGAGNARVMPLLHELAENRVAPDPHMSARLSDGLTNILFVGRIAPNKCIEELLLAFAWYRRCINRASRLIIVGSERSCPRYCAMLWWLAARLGAGNVQFEGFVSESELAAVYGAAGLFVTASRHEGFCLPLLEAVARDVPVLARASGGMPEALGASGVLFDGTDAKELAVLMDRVLSDDVLRREILTSQAERMKEIRARDMRSDCLQLIG